MDVIFRNKVDSLIYILIWCTSSDYRRFLPIILQQHHHNTIYFSLTSLPWTFPPRQFTRVKTLISDPYNYYTHRRRHIPGECSKSNDRGGVGEMGTELWKATQQNWVTHSPNENKCPSSISANVTRGILLCICFSSQNMVFYTDILRVTYMQSL